MSASFSSLAGTSFTPSERLLKLTIAASTAAFQAGPLMAIYYASKAFVLSFSEALHDEMKPHGIHVSCLCPGATETEFGAIAQVTKTMLFKGAGGPEKVVSDGLAALKANKAIAVSGLAHKTFVLGTRLLPRSSPGS